MSVMPYATVVGVFRDRSAADLAMQALANAGFKSEQMRYLVADAAGGFLDSLKSVFTGLSPAEESLVSNLTNMGLSSDEARYFSDEYVRGSVILAIKTQGDEEMALNILYEYGAANAKERARFGGVMASPNRPVSSTGPNEYTAPVYAAALAPEPVLSQSQGTETHSTQDDQQNEAMANSSVDVPSLQTQPPLFDFTPLAYSVETTPRANTILSPEEISDNRAEPVPQEAANDLNVPLPVEEVNNPDTSFSQDTSNDTNVPFSQEGASDSDAPFPQEIEQTPGEQADEIAPEQEEIDVIEETVTPAYSDEQVTLIDPEVIEVVEIDEIDEDETPVDQTNTDTEPQIVTETDAEPQNADWSSPQVIDTPIEQSAEEETAFAEQSAEEPTFQASGNDISTHAGELQELLAQIETTKQQLEGARSQLEEAKQHESQLTTARLQLKELQAELQATQAELQQTHQRISG